MNSAEQQAWSRPPEQMDQMAQMNSDLDDLGNLFEFGDIDLNPISAVDSAHYGDHIQHPGTHPSTPFDEINEAQAISGSSAQDFGSHGQFGMSQNVEQQQHHFDGRPQTSHPYPQDPMYQSAMQAQQHPYYTNQQFQFQGLQGFPPNQVPPTPNSFGMHGEQGPFMQQQMDPQQRAILEQRYHLSKENSIALTPMASPAGTPQYNVQPEFTIPGAYFSPLTSPILPPQNGQNGAHGHQGYYTNPSTAPSSNATSPLDPNADVDMGGDDVSESAGTQAKKSKKSSKKKTATRRSAGPLARVKNSPIQKAMKRKSGTMLSSLAPPRECDKAPPRSSSAQPPSAGLQMPRNDSSENGSISPEPLSEALMGPPPRPGSSLNQSPALPGQQQDGSSSLGKAATPKSLLSMRGDQRGANQRHEQQQGDVDNDQMEFEELQLPAAAADDSASRPPLPQINTQIQQSNSNDDTPRLAARKTPKLGPSSTPSSARPSSSMASPSVMGSPMTASTPGALLKDRKQDPKGGKPNKKRGSMSGTGSALVSPALRPRISPSIKPLLPEGASLHSPTHALLLASKSNYQNLLEGNHLPGVNYPDSLSTGLTSKRTSHKVAEQGRRNRINEALKEMQALLPKTATKKESNSDGSPEAMIDGDKESKEDAQVKSNSSKAATVESANEYIRKLQKENALLLMIKKEHEEMKKKLDEQGNSAASTESSASAVGSASPAPAS
ncbi:hypothetical protein M409DRAFT_70450 [Zasmidium cellare ATCC 36951]|uniref:BHLH domain-containing protein n=1 Tax=Zasmidium cellare ATCC 36951 TaxID=1080233 RepID=A0A6A6C418_ZASCE|nr:uncharacterized protein M409DRAFT_70450 [Zasmidium cellare ATCC 36951]KAF2160489.1 hypothetical protein M409DRAFT_70450 [Zasmidium cellare ATCC 36951]